MIVFNELRPILLGRNCRVDFVAVANAAFSGSCVVARVADLVRRGNVFGKRSDRNPQTELSVRQKPAPIAALSLLEAVHGSDFITQTGKSGFEAGMMRGGAQAVVDVDSNSAGCVYSRANWA